MKTISKIMAMMLIALAPMTFISCADDDDIIADTLEGTWKGKMYVYHTYGGHDYEAVWSEISFDNKVFRNARGNGYWVDHYSSEMGWGHDYVANHITWKVRDEIIYIHFVEDNYDIEIRNYRLNMQHFVGTIYDDGTTVDFSLTHTDYGYNSSYWNDYTYGWDDGWYWGNYGKAFGDVEAPKTPAPPVRHFGTPKE